MLRSNEKRAALPTLMKAGMQLSMLGLGSTPRSGQLIILSLHLTYTTRNASSLIYTFTAKKNHDFDVLSEMKLM